MLRDVRIPFGIGARSIGRWVPVEDRLARQSWVVGTTSVVVGANARSAIADVELVIVVVQARREGRMELQALLPVEAGALVVKVEKCDADILDGDLFARRLIDEVVTQPHRVELGAGVHVDVAGSEVDLAEGAVDAIVAWVVGLVFGDIRDAHVDLEIVVRAYVSVVEHVWIVWVGGRLSSKVVGSELGPSEVHLKVIWRVGATRSDAE